jgi:hypothetical protein
MDSTHAKCARISALPLLFGCQIQIWNSFQKAIPRQKTAAGVPYEVKQNA